MDTRKAYQDFDHEISRRGAWRKKEIQDLLRAFDLNFEKKEVVDREAGERIDPSNFRTVTKYRYTKLDSDEDGRQPIAEIDRVKFRTVYIILYSHWEGHIKDLFRTYLSFLGAITFQDLPNHPALLRKSILFYLEDAASKIKQTTRTCLPEELEKAVTEFNPSNFNSLEHSFPEKVQDQLIKTSSNLRADRLKDIFKNFDLEWTDFFNSQEGTIKYLLDMRNGIAHGDPGRRFQAMPDEDKYKLPETIVFVQQAFTEVEDLLLNKARSTLPKSSSWEEFDFTKPKK